MCVTIVQGWRSAAAEFKYRELTAGKTSCSTKTARQIPTRIRDEWRRFISQPRSPFLKNLAIIIKNSDTFKFKEHKQKDMRIDEEVMECLKQTGPATPLELARKLSSNSLIISGILVNAANNSLLKKSRRRVGGDRLYYVPEHENRVKERIKGLLTPQDRETLQKVMSEKVMVETKIPQDNIPLLLGLEDLVARYNFQKDGQQIRCWAVPNLSEEEAMQLAEKKLIGDAKPKPAPAPAPAPKPVPPAAQKKLDEVKEVQLGEAKRAVDAKHQIAPKKEEVKEEKKAVPKGEVKEVPKEEKKEAPKVEKKSSIPKDVLDEERERIRKEVLAEMKGSFQDNVLHWLEKKEIDVMEEKIIKEGQEVEFEVKVPTPLGRQQYIVRIFDYPKQSVTQNDVSAVGMDAVSRRTPAIIISSTGFSKSAINYWKKEVADMITLVSEDDLE